MPELGICKLCETNGELQHSHIIPAFAFRWLKKTSGNGYIRFGMTPNQRSQDGYKFYWLCKPCEDRLNEWETEFSNKIFHPINQNTSHSADYRAWFLRFCVSVSWRVLNCYFEEGHLSNFSPEHLDAAKKASMVWQEFLLGNRPHPDIFEQHFIPLDAIEDHTFDQTKIPPNINRYILRSIDMDIVSGERSAFTYTKMGRFVIIGFIIPPDRRFWKNTKVHVNSGKIAPTQYTLPIEFADYLFDKAKRGFAIFDKMSDAQHAKVDEEFRKNIERLVNSETLKAMEYDVNMFGENAFYKRKPPS